MQIKSNITGYGSISIAFHWISAAIILGLLGLGFTAASTGDLALKARILRLHVPLGVLILLLTVLRLLWRWVDRKPPPVSGMPLWQNAARAVHALFYVTLIALGASGIAMIAMSGAAAVLFDGSAARLPDFRDYAPRGPHGVAAFVMVGLIAIHVAAVIYHQFVRRDRLLARMGIGRNEVSIQAPGVTEPEPLKSL